MTDETQEPTQTNPEKSLYGEEPKAVVPEETQPPAEGTPAPEDAKSAPEEKSDSPSERVEYNVQLPEGSHLVKADLERIVTFARKHGLSNEEANQLAQEENKRLEDFESKTIQSQVDQSNNWFDELKRDPDFGGTYFEASTDAVRKTIERFGDSELKTALHETGFGNFPPLAKMLARIGRAMANDTLVRPGEAPAPKKSMEEIFYGAN